MASTAQSMPSGLVDRVVDLEPEQLVALWVHRVDVAVELVLHEVAEQRRAERAVPVRGPDHRDRLGPQQAIDLLVGEAPLGHDILSNFERGP
jgi:hypothetical protein